MLDIDVALDFEFRSIYELLLVDPEGWNTINVCNKPSLDCLDQCLPDPSHPILLPCPLFYQKN
jgi:hypothetical protein